MLRTKLVLKHCSKLILKNDHAFNPETAAFNKQKALGEKMKLGEETKE